MKVYVGMDLHATNTYVGMVDEENKVLHKQRFRNELPLILAGLSPFKKDIEGVVVESTFNWYWLVDGLMDQGYRVHLANVSTAIKQYEGLKQIDDQRSAFWLANLLRLGILPTGYIYPKEERPTRGNTVPYIHGCGVFLDTAFPMCCLPERFWAHGHLSLQFCSNDYFLDTYLHSCFNR